MVAAMSHFSYTLTMMWVELLLAIERFWQFERSVPNDRFETVSVTTDTNTQFQVDLD
jgi:hypothetical protein